MSHWNQSHRFHPYPRCYGPSAGRPGTTPLPASDKFPPSPPVNGQQQGDAQLQYNNYVSDLMRAPHWTSGLDMNVYQNQQLVAMFAHPPMPMYMPPMSHYLPPPSYPLGYRPPPPQMMRQPQLTAAGEPHVPEFPLRANDPKKEDESVILGWLKEPSKEGEEEEEKETPAGDSSSEESLHTALCSSPAVLNREDDLEFLKEFLDLERGSTLLDLDRQSSTASSCTNTESTASPQATLTPELGAACLRPPSASSYPPPFSYYSPCSPFTYM